jgi:Cysteine-rich CPXCG
LNRSKPRVASHELVSDARSIDIEYGLEPVFEPGSAVNDPGVASGIQFASVQCPYCGESFDTQVDTSSGSTQYIEDCQVCCQPIEFSLEVDHAGAVVALATQRGD